MKKLPGALKTFLEYLPLIVFFIAFKLVGNNLVEATKYLVASSIASLVFVYFYEKTAPKIMVYSTALVVACGLITIIAKDPIFIKMKPTILYLIFASLLYGSLYKKKLVFKDLLGHTIELSDKTWSIFSKRFIYFFLFSAALNECVWRVSSESFWIKFKLIGFPILLILFLLLNSSLITKQHK